MNDLQKAFRQLKIKARILEANSGNDVYFGLQEVFNSELRAFLRMDFSDLSKESLLQLCSWVSSHRPVAPHSFLITLSQMSSKVNA